MEKPWLFQTSFSDDEGESVSQSDEVPAPLRTGDMVPEEESQLLQFLDATPIGLTIHSSTGHLAYINSVGRNLAELHQLSKLSSGRFSELFPLYRAGTQIPYPEDALPTTRAMTGESARAEDIEIQRYGTVIPLEVWATPILNRQQQVIYAITAFQDVSDRKQAESALLEREQFLQCIYEHVQFGIFVVDVLENGEFRDVGHNPFHSQTIGIDTTEMAGTSPAEVLPTEDSIAVLANYRRCIEQETSVTYEEFLPFLGQPFWWLTTLTPIRDQSGRIHRLVGTTANITHLKEAQARLQVLTDNIPGVVCRYRINADGTDAMLYVSSGCEELWELAAEDVLADVGQLWALIPTTDQVTIRQSMRTATQTQSPLTWQWQITTPSGQQRCLEVTARPSPQHDDSVIWDGVILNITNRKQAEAAQQDSEARYKLLAENMTDLVCLHATTGEYRYISPSCESLLGYRSDEMLGQDPRSFIHADDRERVAQRLMSVVDSPPTPITYRIRHQEGHYIWFETLTKPIRDTTGNLVHWQTTSRDVTDRVRVQNQLEYDALHDALTCLPNRYLFLQRLELAINRSRRLGTYQFVVLFLDLDRFKVINDSLGHVVGDQLLIAIAHKLQSTLRSVDLAARLGGDEFVILLEDITDIQEAVHITERILANVKAPLQIGDRTVYTTASAGLVFGPAEYHDASQLLRDADIAMYRAKNQGKACYAIFDVEMHAEALRRLHLENDLRHAVERQEFVLHYQPIVQLDTGYVVGFEALIRWQHPTQGLTSPSQFVTVAEEINLITQLDYWALTTACHQLVEWQQIGPEFSSLKMSVNLSAQDLRDPHFLTQVDEILAQTHLAGQCLTLEITESLLIENFEATINLLSQLKARDIRISIDDFGTGYSSLSYLHRLPADNLKVDYTFVSQMLTDNRNHQIVATIMTLSQQLGLTAIAEGIETPVQQQQLLELGYRIGQGYLFNSPLSAESATALLARQVQH